MERTLFNQIETFLVIARERSIRGAARKLELSPPSVSQSLKLLETRLGLPLFSRTTRSMELTEAGLQLFEQSQPAIQSLKSAVDAVQSLSETPKGRVRITLPKIAFQMVLQPIYAEFCRRYPEIQLEIAFSDGLVDIVNQGFDAGIRFGHHLQEGMVATPLTPPVAEALVASGDYILRQGMPQAPADLAQHQLIQYRFVSSNQLAPLLLDDKETRVQVDIPTKMIVNDTDLIVDAALQGLGIGRVLQPVVQGLLDAGELFPILQPFWSEYPGMYLYFPQHSQKARRIRVLIDFLRENAALAPVQPSA